MLSTKVSDKRSPEIRITFISYISSPPHLIQATSSYWQLECLKHNTEKMKKYANILTKILNKNSKSKQYTV